jgi:outer membrane protein TolC
MINRIFILVLLTVILSAFNGRAQQIISLQQAMDMAVQRAASVQNQSLQNTISQKDVERIASAKLPQLNATADLRYNTKLQTNVIPAGAFGDRPRIVRFGTSYNFLGGLNLTQNLYDPNIANDLAIAKQQIKSGEEQLRELVINEKLLVAQIYYEIVLQKELLKQAESTLDKCEFKLTESEIAFKNGSLLQTDLNRFQLDKNNAEANVQNARFHLNQNLYLLKKETGMPIQDSVMVEDGIESLLQNSAASIDYTGDVLSRPEYKREQNNLVVQSLNKKKYEQAWLPTAQFYGNLSANYLSNDLSNLFSSSWYPFSYVGIRINANLFDGYNRKKNREIAELRMQISQNNLKSQEADFYYEVYKAKNDLSLARLNLQTAKMNNEFAHQLLETDLVRFKNGALLPSQLKDTERSVADADANLVQQIYNFLIADLNLKKAIGKL